MPRISAPLATPLAALVAGLTFGFGLIVSGMADPGKVLAFLDVTGRWDPSLAFVMIGAIATLTTRLRFVTTVYLPAMRDPYSAAKSIGTAALLADGRLELGIGVGWCREEFELLGQQFDRRGKRTDEMLELMKALWAPGWTEYSGEFYTAPRMEMEPTPPPIPMTTSTEAARAWATSSETARSEHSPP